MADLICSDPLHASRSGQPGWAATLGTADQPVTGQLCPACAADPTGAYQTGQATIAAAEANRLALLAQADAARAVNATYLAKPAPTNPEIAAQVRALTQQMNKAIRLLADRFDGTD